MAKYSVVLCGIVSYKYSVVLFSILQCCIVQCGLVLYVAVLYSVVLYFLRLHIHLSLNRGHRVGTTTSFLYFSLFSTALWNLATPRPVHS